MKIQFTFLILLASLLGHFEMCAQKWTQYTTANGLAGDNVTAMAIDKQGNKWFGCYDAISMYDGITFKNYPFSVGYITSVVIDNNNDVWFGTHSKGVYKFDGRIWKNYTTTDGLSSNSINVITIDSIGNKWFGTYSGVTKFDGNTWSTYTIKDGFWRAIP